MEITATDIRTGIITIYEVDDKNSQEFIYHANYRTGKGRIIKAKNEQAAINMLYKLDMIDYIVATELIIAAAIFIIGRFI